MRIEIFDAVILKRDKTGIISAFSGSHEPLKNSGFAPMLDQPEVEK